MARRFVALRYVNCAECEDLIEPGDTAGHHPGRPGAFCEDCCNWLDEVEFQTSYEGSREQ